MSTVTSSSHISASFVSVPPSVHERIDDDHDDNKNINNKNYNNNNKHHHTSRKDKSVTSNDSGRTDIYDKDNNNKFVNSTNIFAHKVHKMRKSTFRPTPLTAFSVAVSCAVVHQTNRISVNSNNPNVVNVNNLNNNSNSNALRNSFSTTTPFNPRSPTSFVETNSINNNNINNVMTNSILQTLHNGSIMDYLTSSMNVNSLGVNSKSFGHIGHENVGSVHSTLPTTTSNSSTATATTGAVTTSNANCNEKIETEFVDNRSDAYWVHLLLSTSVMSASSTSEARALEDDEQESELIAVHEEHESVEEEEEMKQPDQVKELQMQQLQDANDAHAKNDHTELLENEMKDQHANQEEQEKKVKEQQQVAQVRVLWIEFVQLFRFIRSVVPKFRIVDCIDSNNDNNTNNQLENEGSTWKGTLHDLSNLLCEEDARQLGLHSMLSSFSSCCYSEMEESPLSLSSYVLHSSTFSPTLRNAHPSSSSTSFPKAGAIDATSQAANIATKKENNSTTGSIGNKNTNIIKNKSFDKHTISNKHTGLPSAHNVPASPTTASTKGNFVLPNSVVDLQNVNNNKSNNNANNKSNSEIITSSQREQRRLFMELYLNAAIHNTSVNVLRELQSFVGYHTFMKNEEMEFINNDQHSRESASSVQDYRSYNTNMAKDQHRIEYKNDNNAADNSAKVRSSSTQKSGNVFSFSFATSPPTMAMSLRSTGAKSHDLNFITNACRSNSSVSISGNDKPIGEMNTIRQESSSSYESKSSQYEMNREQKQQLHQKQKQQLWNLAQSAPERSPLIPALLLEENKRKHKRERKHVSKMNDEKDKSANSIKNDKEIKEHNVCVGSIQKHEEEEEQHEYKQLNHTLELLTQEYQNNYLAQEKEEDGQCNSQRKQMSKETHSPEKLEEELGQELEQHEEEEEEEMLNASVSALSQPGFPLSNGYVSDDNDDSSLCEVDLHSDKRLELAQYKASKKEITKNKQELNYNDNNTHVNNNNSSSSLHAKSLFIKEDKHIGSRSKLKNKSNNTTNMENKKNKENNTNLASTSENRETTQHWRPKDVERQYQNRQRERRRRKSRPNRQRRVEAIVNAKMSLLEECFKMLDEHKQGVISIDKITLFMLCATDFTFQDVLRNIHCIDITDIHANTRSSSYSPSHILNLKVVDATTQNNRNNNLNNKNEVKLIDWLQNILNKFCTELQTDTDNAHLQKSNANMNAEEHADNVDSNNDDINNESNNAKNLNTRREQITFEQFIKLVQRVLLKIRELCHEVKKSEKDKDQGKKERIDQKSVETKCNKKELIQKEIGALYSDNLTQTEEERQTVKNHINELTNRHAMKSTLLSTSAPLSRTRNNISDTILSMCSSVLTSENDSNNNNTVCARKKTNTKTSSQVALGLSKERNTALCATQSTELENNSIMNDKRRNSNENRINDNNKKAMENELKSSIVLYDVKLTMWIDHFWLVQYAVIYSAINEIVNGESQRLWREQLHTLTNRIYHKNIVKEKMHSEQSKEDKEYIEEGNINYANKDNTEEKKEIIGHVEEVNVDTLFNKMTLEEKDELERLYSNATNEKQREFDQENNECSCNKHNVDENEGNKEFSKGIVEQIYEEHNAEGDANTNNNNGDGKSIIICCGNFVQYSVNKTQLINLLYIISSANVLHAVSETEVQRWLVMEPFMQHFNFTFPELCAMLDVLSRRIHFSELLRCLCITSTTPSLQQNKYETKQQNVNVLSLFARATLATLPYTTGELKEENKDDIKNENTNDDAKHEGVNNNTTNTTATTTNIHEMKMSHKQETEENYNNDKENEFKWTSTLDSVQEKLKELVEAHQRRVNGGHILCANCDYMKQQYNEHKKCNETLETKVQTLQIKVQELTSQLERKCKTLETVEESLTETKRLLADAELREAELYDLLDNEHHAQLTQSSSLSLHHKSKTDEIANATSQMERTEKLESINTYGDECSNYVNEDVRKVWNRNENINTSETLAELNEVSSNRHDEDNDNNDINMDESMENNNQYGEVDAKKVACELQRDKLNNDSPAGDLFNDVCPVWLQSTLSLRKIKIIKPYVFKENIHQGNSNTFAKQCNATQRTKILHNKEENERYYIHDGRVLTQGWLTYDFTSTAQETINSFTNLSRAFTREADTIAGLQIDLFNTSLSKESSDKKEKITLRCASGARRVSLMLYKSELYILTYSCNKATNNGITEKSKLNKPMYREQYHSPLSTSSLAHLPAKHAAFATGRSNHNTNKYTNTYNNYYEKNEDDNFSNALMMLRLREQFTPYSVFHSSSESSSPYPSPLRTLHRLSPQREWEARYESNEKYNSNNNSSSNIIMRRDNFDLVKLCTIEPQCWYRLGMEFQWDDATCRVHVQPLSSQTKSKEVEEEKKEDIIKVEDDTHTCDIGELENKNVYIDTEMSDVTSDNMKNISHSNTDNNVVVNNWQKSLISSENALLSFGPFHLLPVNTTGNAVDMTNDNSHHNINHSNKNNSGSRNNNIDKWNTCDCKDESDIAALQEDENDITQMEIHPR